MLESVHFSKGCNCPPAPLSSPCVRKQFLLLLIYIFISCMQSHSHSFLQDSPAKLMSVECRLSTQQVMFPSNIN